MTRFRDLPDGIDRAGLTDILGRPIYVGVGDTVDGDLVATIGFYDPNDKNTLLPVMMLDPVMAGMLGRRLIDLAELGYPGWMAAISAITEGRSA